MTLLNVPDIEKIVSASCKDLIDKYRFAVQKKSKNEIHLVSAACGIRIIAGISPIGERQIDIDFYDPNCRGEKRMYYSDLSLLYLKTRAEPRDILNTFQAEKGSFEETLAESLKCISAHTMKYREDILDGDFSTWLP